MKDYKKEVYEILSTLPYNIVLASDNVFADFPVISYFLADNTPEYDLSNEILQQNINVNIDIWTNSSVKGSEILEELELKMREYKYRLTFSSDVPNIDMNVYHISCRFEK